MKTIHQSPPLLLAGVLALASTPLLLLIASWQAEPDQFQIFLFLAIGCGSCGCGEILNHPHQTDFNFTENETSELRRIRHRRRNPCMLGNLLLINGLLFSFIACGAFILS